MSQTFNFPSQTYPAGQHVVGPFTMPTGVNQMQINFTLDSASLNDPNEQLDWEFDFSKDSGASWHTEFSTGPVGQGGGWVAPMLNPKTGLPTQPEIVLSGLDALVGNLCKLVITTSDSVTTAIQVQVS